MKGYQNSWLRFLLLLISQLRFGLVGILKKSVAVTTNIWSVITNFWVKMYLFNPFAVAWGCSLLWLSTGLEIVSCGFIKNSWLRVSYAVMQLTDHSLVKTFTIYCQKLLTIFFQLWTSKMGNHFFKSRKILRRLSDLEESKRGNENFGWFFHNPIKQRPFQSKSNFSLKSCKVYTGFQE